MNIWLHKVNRIEARWKDLDLLIKFSEWIGKSIFRVILALIFNIISPLF